MESVLFQSMKADNRSPQGPRRGLFCTLFTSLLLCFVASSLFGATFTATLDRDTITVGDTATLTLKFEGGDPKAVPMPPEIPNLQIGDAGNGRNITIINGETSSSFSQNFTLTPTQPGDFDIPALRAEVGGQILTSQPLKLKAVK